MTRTLVLVAALALARAAAAQQPDTLAPLPLSLDDAVRLATVESGEVELARSRVAVADEQVVSARGAALPQINASFGFTRTLASVFDAGGGFELPDSLRFEPDSTLPLGERVTYLEDRVPAAAFGSLGQLFGDLPFGQENAYAISVTGSQLVYSGGRVGSALEIAHDFVDAAELNLIEERAELELQVRSAYYRALLARELERISVEALAQAERFFGQEQLRLEAGRASELDVLRAEVSRDNLRPQLVEARNAADLALLDLKRLVDVPLQRPLELTTGLDAPDLESDGGAVTQPSREFRTDRRASVLAADRQVSIAREQVSVAKSAFLPDVSLSTAYGRQLFPSSAFDLRGDWRTDWTVSLNVSIPVFSGLRRFADVSRAQVQLRQAELQLEQLQEAVQLEYRQAEAERERAVAAIAARRRTASMAERVYELTVLRYDEGQATQLEVQQARLDLLQARTNLAQAIADFHIADARVLRSMAGSGRAAGGVNTSSPGTTR
ncbi:MAG: TolC family protein [Gemmatimonadota bacterium]